MTLIPDPAEVLSVEDATSVDRAVSRHTAGRSLWGDALRRFVSNRVALGSLIALGVMTLLCLIGPPLLPNAYDRVFQDYVRTAPSLAPYPHADDIRPAIERVTSRLRADLADYSLADRTVHLKLTSSRPFDERAFVLFERSDNFGRAQIVTRSDDKLSYELAIPVRRLYFPFGTDGNGRDLLGRTLIAGRISLFVGLLASAVALLIGVVWGAIAGYAGGRTDMVMMRIVDILYALPFIFFVILLVVFFGRNVVLVFVAIGAVEWLDMARIVRGQALSIKRQEFVAAAEALGVPPAGILTRHIVPNALGPVVVYLTLLVPKVILLESFLSFLGLGVQEPLTSLGVLIADGARNIQGTVSLLIFPAVFLTALLFALNFVGDGLRDALDPREH